MSFILQHIVDYYYIYFLRNIYIYIIQLLVANIEIQSSEISVNNIVVDDKTPLSILIKNNIKWPTGSTHDSETSVPRIFFT